MKKEAFTILELVIVLSVLVILIGIAIPRIKGMQQAGQIAQVRAELQTFQTAVESYYSNSSPHMYPGVAGTADVNIDNKIGAAYLVTATPQIITSPLYDPYNPNGASIEYYYYLSSNGQYYVISSMGPNGAWGCFIAGTKVLLADGRVKAIESLKAGDVLRGAHGEPNKVINLKVLSEKDRKIYAFNGGRYFVTGDHPFMTTDGWKAIEAKASQQKYTSLKVGQLKVGHELVTFNGSLRLKKIEYKIIKNSVVYDLQLDGSHLFYSDGFLVHNVMPVYSGPQISIGGVVSFGSVGKGDDICVTNGSGC